MPRLRRIADIAGLVVRDRDPLPTRQLERRGDRVGGRSRVVAAGGGARIVVGRFDVDAIPAAANPVSTESEAELPLDVGGDDRVRLELRRAEPAQRLAARGQASILVIARQEPFIGPGGFEGRVQLLLAHDLAAGMTAMELLHGPMDGGPIDHRVVRRYRDPHDVAELVLERTGQIGVDAGERQGKGLARRAAFADRADRCRSRRRGFDPVDRPGRAHDRVDRCRRKVERFEHER